MKRILLLLAVLVLACAPWGGDFGGADETLLSEDFDRR